MASSYQFSSLSLNKTIFQSILFMLMNIEHGIDSNGDILTKVERLTTTKTEEIFDFYLLKIEPFWYDAILHTHA